MIRSRPGQATIVAFIAMVVLGGANGVAIRVSNQELAPFWGATVRFGLASAVLFAIVALGRIPLPRGRALTGSLVYGVLTFGTAFALVYWALVDAPAGLGQVILALVPLLTLMLAVMQGLERFHWQGVAGALLALLGIAVVFGDRIGTTVPVVSTLAFLTAAGSGYGIGLDDEGRRIEFIGDWRALAELEARLANEVVYVDVEGWQVIAVNEEIRLDLGREAMAERAAFLRSALAKLEG